MRESDCRFAGKRQVAGNDGTQGRGRLFAPGSAAPKRARDLVTPGRSTGWRRRSTATIHAFATATRCRRSATGCSSCPARGSRTSAPDGHPQRGGFLPPVHELPRRMWAGSRLSFPGKIRVGDAIVRRSTIASVDAQGRRQRPAGVRHGAPRDRPRRRSRCHHRRARHRLSRPAGAGGKADRSMTEPGRMAAHAGARRGAAVPLFGADLQRPPHPLRPRLCDEGGRLSRPGRARPADRHAARRPCPPPCAAGAHRNLCLQGRVAAVRRQRDERQCSAAGRRRRRETVGGQRRRRAGDDRGSELAAMARRT